MVQQVNVRLEKPETTLSEVSFAETSTSAINQWAAELPLANIDETALQLKLATAELALLEAAPGQKFEFLEAVRPLIHYICTRLDRAHLAVAKSAAESEAQRLLLNLCTGYKGVVLEALEVLATLESTKKDKQANKDIVVMALHRLISDLSRIHLRTLQLYVAPMPNFWWELNELFRLAENLECCDFSMDDDENHGGKPLCIEDAYLRAVLLDCCKPNQLKHAQLNSVFNALESWAGTVAMAAQQDNALLVIDLMADTGPQYSKLAKNPAEPRGLHTEILAYEIEAYLNEVDSHFVIPASLNRALLQHLVDAWSVMQARAFGRFSTKMPVRVAVGLRATHYFLSGGCQFGEQLSNADELLRREVNPFLDVAYVSTQPEDPDPWSQAHDLKVRMPINPNIEAPETILLKKPATEAQESHFVHYETVALDSSPGGYRMRWLEAVPANATVGELISLREEKASRWCVAVIRWIRQEGKYISMGVELLSPRAIPVAVRAIQTKGGRTDFARGLLLPQIEAIRQTATLVTPTVPFVGRQKVHIQRQGIQTTSQLLESQLKTESFNQFTFRMLDGYLENNRSDSNIDSLSAMTREDTTQGP